MIQFTLLGSGSGGNAALITSPAAKILVDGGLSLRQMRQRTDSVGLTLDGLDAVFVTHEHSDHVAGLGPLARHLRVPVYMTRGTWESLPRTVGDLPDLRLLEPGEEVAIDGLTVASFSVSHDAADPVSYCISHDGVKLGMAADLGQPTQLVRSRLRGSHALVLESNYCPYMLAQGSYPPRVQQRIRGRQGHLSNSDMSTLLQELLHQALRFVVLVHVSEENNTARLAYETALKALGAAPVEVFVARQDQPTRVFELEP